ncbi:MAG TPA: polysaccharide deacetylase [Burkholderiaceae bacterium]|jgi:peptidoglycan-N-acetylglucosamine deacetylase|nr:polysaccharide deacetylase [Burkholderiaceae bacterium]
MEGAGQYPLNQDASRESVPVPWPNGARCAVMITFDFDAETMWLSRDVTNSQRPALLSHGTYAAKVAVPEILRLLRELEIPATFFVPGWTAENHAPVVASILEAGHEIGHHGYLHFWPEPDKPADEEREIELGLEVLQKLFRLRPKGYRCPAGETTLRLIPLLSKYGFSYDSSFMDDIHPYVHKHDGRRTGVVELPWHWSLDDVPFMVYSLRNQRPMQTNEHVLAIWKAEFHEHYQRGALFDLIMHPQAIGRPSRLAMLREFLSFIRSYPNVWLATGTAVSAHVLEVTR